MTLIVSTGNYHKTDEIKQILGGAQRILSLHDFPKAPCIVEDASTFEGNAIKKAMALCSWLRRFDSDIAKLHADDEVWILADDSGLEVDALSGAPGVHSARFASLDGADPESPLANASDTANNAKLLRLLEGLPEVGRRARFRCVLALVPLLEESSETSGPTMFSGACEGRITEVASGTAGFGYDPLFIPDGYEQSFAELGEEIKNRISHRSRALHRLQDFLKNKKSGT